MWPLHDLSRHISVEDPYLILNYFQFLCAVLSCLYIIYPLCLDNPFLLCGLSLESLSMENFLDLSPNLSQMSYVVLLRAP